MPRFLEVIFYGSPYGLDIQTKILRKIIN